MLLLTRRQAGAALTGGAAALAYLAVTRRPSRGTGLRTALCTVAAAGLVAKTSSKARNTEDRVAALVGPLATANSTANTAKTVTDKISGNATFLGNLSQMSALSGVSTPAGQTSTGGWSTGGALQGGSSQFWDNGHAAALVPWMNQVFADIDELQGQLTAVINRFNSLESELSSNNFTP